MASMPKTPLLFPRAVGYHGRASMRGTSLFRALALAAALLAVGCRQAPDRAAGPEAAAGKPRRGGTVVTGWTAEPGGVNSLILPNSQPTNEMLFRLFLHLVEEQADFQRHPATFKPQLAESYDCSADHKTCTFHLRKDVVWSDGVPVTADDVRWTWVAQKNPDVAWELADSKRWITDVEVVDPHTVRFHFSRVYAKQLLDINEGPVFPKHAWEKLPFKEWRQNGDWFRQHLVGDGPCTILTSVWAPDPSIHPLPFDPKEAARILAAKGWKDTDGDGVLDKDGKLFAFELLVNTGNQLRADAAVMIQSQLQKVGIRATPRQIEFNTLGTAMESGKFEAAIMGYTIDTSLDLRSNFHSESIQEGSNYPRYRNPEMDRLLEVAQAQPDLAAERPYLYQVQQMVQRDQPLTFLWESQRLTAVNKRLKNVHPTATFSFFNLKEWWIEP